MGDVGACWDNALMERFLGSLKHEWVLLIPQPTRAGMKRNVMLQTILVITTLTETMLGMGIFASAI